MIFPAQPINTGVTGFLAAVFSGRMAKNFFPPETLITKPAIVLADEIEKIETPEGDGNIAAPYSSKQSEILRR